MAGRRKGKMMAGGTTTAQNVQRGKIMTENQERAYEELTKFQSLQSEIRILELKLFISIQAESLKECT